MVNLTGNGLPSRCSRRNTASNFLLCLSFSFLLVSELEGQPVPQEVSGETKEVSLLPESTFDKLNSTGQCTNRIHFLHSKDFAPDPNINA